MIVVAHDDAGLPGLLPRAVQQFCNSVVTVKAALIFRQPGQHHVLLTERHGSLNFLIEIAPNGLQRHMGRWRSETKAVQDSAHLSGGLTVVPGKLHFLKPDLCKLSQGAFEVFSHFPTQRIQLQPNFINPPHLGARRTKRACRKRSGNCCLFEELSSGLTARLKSFVHAASPIELRLPESRWAFTNLIFLTRVRVRSVCGIKTTISRHRLV